MNISISNINKENRRPKFSDIEKEKQRPPNEFLPLYTHVAHWTVESRELPLPLFPFGVQHLH